MPLGIPYSDFSVLLAFLIIAGIQVVFYLTSATLKTEVLYDFSGMLSYQAAVITLLIVNNINGLCPRQIILAGFVLIWTTRLGIFLFIRVLSRPDDRFDHLKGDFFKFSVPWMLQILWVFISPLPVYILLGNNNQRKELIWSDWIGIIVWTFGFLVEVIADVQKQTFKKTNPKDFCSIGIWQYSRYANYFGEVVLWYGIFIIAAAGVVDSWNWVMIISPLFVNALLLYGSGVALSEQGAQKRYGEREDFKLYCATTSKFILWPPRRRPPP